MVVVYRGDQSLLGCVPRRRPAKPSFNSYDGAFARAHLCYEKEQAKLFNGLRPPSFADRLANPVARDTVRMNGRERLAKVRHALNSYGLERSDMQKQFHEDMIGACARLIFKDDLEAELDDLLLELGVDELHSEFMAITPRRFGKTYSVAMFVVAMMFAVEGLEQAIFSTGRRASQKLLELVYRFLCKIPGMRESILKHNVETIWIRGPNGDQDVRKVFSYPSNVRISSGCAVSWGWASRVHQVRDFINPTSTYCKRNHQHSPPMLKIYTEGRRASQKLLEIISRFIWTTYHQRLVVARDFNRTLDAEYEAMIMSGETTGLDTLHIECVPMPASREADYASLESVVAEDVQ